ncbi:uncharacterized protein C8R40DRAFT_1156219 [Lentinula edodes]|uniref:uncharacterized protein n=1 Tax=Lentinula edodes TaxID=5353 RepID=UPI001E8CF404|nr:uncharacterized protein C8R40DRAFT_1156219 [Lentinula edodes]KAH7868822.1 hypothetical protein C8R40DRAFT_1156219 [Lentinula edodes]
MFEDTTIPGDGSSGTTASQADSIHINSINAVNLQPELPEVPTKARAGGDEEALESHQVIELQIFSERKAWIEEKIKLLEQMPPIEVFVGLDAVQASAEEVPGLPTREELKKWLAEHDTLEKETEIFDTGELKKLRNFTRAATQRNLSPEDTDLIELTLTTIYALDKLLHLLRDRSETLDLLGVRLSWEENRISSWVERRKIIADLQAFLESRAQWSALVYDNPPKTDPTLEDHRRGSVSSLASVASDTSINSPAFSRSTRFRLAELLSRDAATLSARVSSLRHGSVAASGKFLDKLIDNSRKPVPEVLLDEQDRIDEKCVNDMENIGKFVLNVVMQWRKADEIYVETMKDQFAAQTLLEDIESAMMQQPTARQSAAFMSRSDALLKRLLLRGNPASSTSTFPRPSHPLFTQQSEFNESLARTLSSEIKSTTELLRNVESLTKMYRASYDAVSRVETLNEAVSSLIFTFQSIIDRLENGIASSEGDGTPPTLMSNECLDPSRHSVFIALLPSLLDELAKTDHSASELVRQVPAALLHLDFPGVDQEFKTNASTQLLRLKTIRERAQRLNEVTVGRVGRLREARRIWTTMDATLKEVEAIRREAVDEIDRCRWRQDTTTNVNGAPPTPESPSTVPLPSDSLQQYTELEHQMTQLGARLQTAVDDPLTSLSTTLELPLKEPLSQSAQNLKSHSIRVQRMIDLLRSIHKQTTVMNGIREEFNALQLRLDDIMTRYESKTENVLDDTPIDEQVSDTDESLSSEFAATRSNTMVFINNLAQRVPLVGSSSQVPIVKRSFSTIDLTSTTRPEGLLIELPFDLHSVDDSVRADCNSYTMRLNGQVHALEQKVHHFHLSQIAKELDASTSALLNEIDQASSQFTTLHGTFTGLQNAIDVINSLTKMTADIEQSSSTHRSRLNRSLTAVREIHRRLESAPGILDSNVHDRVLLSRTRGISQLEGQITSWEANIESLRARVVAAQEAAVYRMQREKEEEEARLAAERERVAKEEAEHAQAEKFRQEEEERRRLEQARLAEEEERARLEMEQQEETERIRLNEIRLAEEAQAKEEQKKLALEEAEKARLEKERIEMVSKLKDTEGKLLAERKLHAEKERMAAEEARMARLEREKLDEERNHAIKELEAANISLEEDVFGVRITPADGHSSMSTEIKDVLALMARLRKRLRSIGINDAARPQSSNSVLPRADRARAMRQELMALKQEVGSLPDNVEVVSVNVQLKSLRNDIETSFTLLDRIDCLAALSEALCTCDDALSDLLEHIDSFPATPLGPLSSSYTNLSSLIPEEQLSDRLSFTKSTIEAVTNAFEVVKGDPRAIVENERVLQTWSELEEMGNDRVHGTKSRPSSVMSTQSSGHDSRVSLNKSQLRFQPGPSTSAKARKSGSYATLSVSSSTPRGRLNVPSPTPSQSRRAFSGSDEPGTRSNSRMSTRSSQQRTISGGSLYGTTYASRQRTTSLTGAAATPPPKRNFSGGHTRSQTATASQKKRDPSPSLSDASLSFNGRSSTWSKAPRISFSGVPRVSTPQKRPSAPRKAYVANPKSKLDVAVGDVVNSLPIGINIEGVFGSWKDQSGKYWIGDQEPKLCFCRILRSQTVMVRVGGGWSELSKFIRDHFADSFRLLAPPDSPGMHTSGEERWISSATLLEEREQNTPPGPPRTPEPRGPLLPSFSLSTPSGHSPQSMMSTPSTRGSPLTPLQFMRRAEPEAPFFARPETPTKSPSRPRTIPTTPARQSVWRP